ncbi:glycosyltransferase family 2 protein [Cryobacterium sp. CG_9.6]|uniref:glycosyltransferase family 2 protein n=1 Tax=Cryobacterium sp. CG_9.6 TaxID=2760710 RepID=UPI00247516B2|nr:glycosyltransferase family 2 protein [Cryobacterium sp. CG_9.6]MDH6238270.1 GT2 family glycosyltransferase [Cryobacterium sp. CG_9.6]
MRDLTLVIVAYKSADDMITLLASVAAAVDELTWHAIVVDNYGDDGIAAAHAADSRVTVVTANGNLGFSGGANLGLGYATPSHFTIFLNPDLVLEAGSISSLVETCRKEGIGATVPLLTNESGVIQPSLRREPSMLRSLGEALFGDHWPGRPHWLSEMVRSNEPYRTMAPVDWATGAALLVKTNVLGFVGEWDAARFFLYSEETDYCRRIRQSGLQIVFVPGAIMRHRGAGSGTSIQLDALLALNKLRYFRKWHGSVASAMFYGVAVVHSLVRVRRAESRLILRALSSPSVRAALPGGKA